MAGSGGPGEAPREHRLQPGDTLPGLALRYGVTMEQIQRANRLYASDSIFLKRTLLIPAPGHPEGPFPGNRHRHRDGDGDRDWDQNRDCNRDRDRDRGQNRDCNRDWDRNRNQDLDRDQNRDQNRDQDRDQDRNQDRAIPGSGPDPLSSSRHDLSASDFLRRLDAEIGRCKEAAAQQIRDTGPAPPRGGPGPSSPRGAQLGPRPLTRTPRAAALRDSEDEIFTL